MCQYRKNGMDRLQMGNVRGRHHRGYVADKGNLEYSYDFCVVERFSIEC